MTLPAGSCILVPAFRAFVFPAHALNWICAFSIPVSAL